MPLVLLAAAHAGCARRRMTIWLCSADNNKIQDNTTSNIDPGRKYGPGEELSSSSDGRYPHRSSSTRSVTNYNSTIGCCPNIIATTSTAEGHIVGPPTIIFPISSL